MAEKNQTETAPHHEFSVVGGSNAADSVEPRGLAACLEVLELITAKRRYSELSLALPAGDGKLLLLDPGRVASERGQVRGGVQIGDYKVEYVATNADNRRGLRRFVRVLAIEPEPQFAVLVRIYKEWGYVMAKFDVVLRGCVKDRPRVWRFALGDVYEIDAAVEIGDREYTLRRP